MFSLYRKYGVIGQKKAEVKYVVARKGRPGARPDGDKGPYKVVDKRLKKDKRAAKQRNKSGKKKQSSGKGRKQQQRSSKNNKGSKRT